jgi:hypothetical protein
MQKFSLVDYKVQKQKTLAGSILRVLQGNGIFAWVEGGAARDWWLEYPAKDLDIYFDKPADVETPAQMNDLLWRVGFGCVNKTLPSELKAAYENMDESIFSVNDYEIDGEAIQFISCTEGAADKYKSFSLNISQARWHPDYGYSYTDAFIMGHQDKEILQMQDGFNAHSSYVSRMNLKFMHKGYKPLLWCL